MGTSSSKSKDLESEIKALKAKVEECEHSLQNSNITTVTKSPAYTTKHAHQALHHEKSTIDTGTFNYDVLSVLTDNTLNSMYTPKLGIPSSYNMDNNHNEKSQHMSTQIDTANDTVNFFKTKTFEPNECKLKCNADPNCELYVHNAKQNVCWFKHVEN